MKTRRVGAGTSTSSYQPNARSHPSSITRRCPTLTFRLHEEASEGLKATAARALEFTVLTAGRTSETLLAKRSEIDLKARMWTVPAGRMKKRKEHRVPLCDRAVAIIKATSGDYLFPGTRPGRPLSKDAMSELLKTMGISADDVTMHGFRSTFTDWAAETTHYPKELRDLATAHKIGDQVEAAYRRGDMLAKRHALMADWERFSRSQR